MSPLHLSAIKYSGKKTKGKQTQKKTERSTLLSCVDFRVVSSVSVHSVPPAHLSSPGCLPATSTAALEVRVSLSLAHYEKR